MPPDRRVHGVDPRVDNVDPPRLADNVDQRVDTVDKSVRLHIFTRSCVFPWVVCFPSAALIHPPEVPTAKHFKM